MEYLKCFTVKDDIEEGIYVDDFESIIVADPSTTSIKNATLELIPVLPVERGNKNVTENSLVFLHEPNKKDKLSSSHVIIAVDPEKWKLCYSTADLSILDPCGIHGLVMLLVNNKLEHVLVNADKRNLSLQFSDKKLCIAPCGRAALLRDAVTARKLTAVANTLPNLYRQTSPITE